MATDDTKRSVVEQTLARLYRLTWRSGCRLHLSKEDLEDASADAVAAFLLDFTQADGSDTAVWDPNRVLSVSEEELRKRALEAVRKIDRQHRRDEAHRVRVPGLTGRSDELPDDMIDIADPCRGPDEELQEREFQRAIEATLGALPDNLGFQFREHHVRRVTFAELGRQYGCSSEAIRKRLARVRRRIVDELTRDEWDETGSA